MHFTFAWGIAVGVVGTIVVSLIFSVVLMYFLEAEFESLE